MAEETKKKTRRTRKKVTEEKAVVAEQAQAVETAEAKTESSNANEDVLKALQEQNKILMAQVEELKRQASAPVPQVIQVANNTELIDFLWLAPVADDNEFLIAGGQFGKITGKVGNFSIPKNNFSQILDSQSRMFIENRWLIILKGLTDEERRMYGVNYRPGEYLDKEMFMRLIEMQDKVADRYEDLCDASKEIVAKFFYEAWENPAKKNLLRRDLIVRMNKIKAQPGFKAILDAMNFEEAQ